MRALLIGALGLTLLGCSHSPPPQVSASSCLGADVAACDDNAAARPPEPAPSKPRVAAHAASLSPVRAKVASAGGPSKSAKTSADFANAQASVAERQGGERKGVSDSPKTQMAAAQERKDAPASTGNTDMLMAVVMARPDIKSIAELAGKTVAIDERYSRSSGKVRTAIAAAGATEVQLSEGQTTAMNRLGNGEVPAAVVALVTSEAAEAFPAIAGYRIFHVPLSPRSVKSGQAR